MVMKKKSMLSKQFRERVNYINRGDDAPAVMIVAFFILVMGIGIGLAVPNEPCNPERCDEPILPVTAQITSTNMASWPDAQGNICIGVDACFNVPQECHPPEYWTEVSDLLEDI